MAIRYTGTGSDDTPPHVILLMREIGAVLSKRGLVLRTGIGIGAEKSFNQGVMDADGAREMYLPWPEEEFKDGINALRQVTYAKACAIAADHHPVWANLKQPARKRLTANVMKVLGADLKTPSRFLLCWAPNPRFDNRGTMRDASGSTGLTVRLAYNQGIPCFHLDSHKHIARLDSLCGTNFSRAVVPSRMTA